MNEFERVNNQNHNNNATTSTSLSAHPFISLLLLPFTLFYQIIANFKEYFFIITRNDVLDMNEFLATIPQEQMMLENDMDQVQNNQKEIGRDIDDLTRRIQALENRRRKREENDKNWIEEHK